MYVCMYTCMYTGATLYQLSREQVIERTMKQ